MDPLHQHAEYLASFGRNGDNTLVHMSHDEVRALQGLGSLTRNPHTGLPEAFSLGWLGDILPIAGGLASMFIPELSPLAAAGISGLATGVAKKSLGQGLLAGLTSWGLGSLGRAASNAGSAATGAGVGQGASTMGDVTGAGSLAENPVQLGGGVPDTSKSLYGSMGQPAPDVAQSAMGSPQAVSATNAVGQYTGPNWGNIQSNMTNPKWWTSAGKVPGMAAGVGFLGGQMLDERAKQQAAADALNANNAAAQKRQYDAYLQAMGAAHAVNPYSSYYTPGSPMAAPGYATGGLMGDGGLFDLHEMNRMRGFRPDAHHPHDGVRMSSIYKSGFGLATGGLEGDNGRFEHEDSHGQPIEEHGQHGIEGLLTGPGDGMSDHIHTTIEGHTPAQLSNDEFVVPADVVSHLGNGSTSAGAKALYGMMDRIRKARTGNPKQGKQIAADDHLLA